MKILAVGGGSGGHVTPVVAVLQEIRAKHPDAKVKFWVDGGFAKQARRIVSGYDSNIPVSTVMAGKFRRYSHLSKLQHIIRPSIFLANIRDLFFVMGGFLQSLIRLIIWRPNVVFLKGGFVCLPVGYAAVLLRIPIVIHDSDALPGLTNRLLAPVASFIATGVPLKYYDYPAQKSKYVGIPIGSDFKPLSELQRREVKHRFGFDESKPLLLIIGGGLGAEPINDDVVKHAVELTGIASILLITGSDLYDDVIAKAPSLPNLRIESFVSDGLSDIMAAADVVVSRAGATTLLELAAVARPTILIPSHKLLWQIKHAQVFMDSGAVVLLDETKFEMDDDRSLVQAVKRILGDKGLQRQLVNDLKQFAMPNAAKDLADIILKAGK